MAFALTRRYTVKHIGISGYLFQELSIRLVPHLPKKLSANTVTLLGFLSSFSFFYLFIKEVRVAGLFILLALFLDITDGCIARNRGQTSEFGRVFDGFVDLSLYLYSLTAIFFHMTSKLAFAVLIAYVLDLFLRYQLGYPTDVFEPMSHSKRLLRSSQKPENVKRLNLLLHPLVLNHFDTMALLAVLIMGNIQLSYYWLIYELARRTTIALGKFVEMYTLYRYEKHNFN
jgi:hypothetical protein